MNNEINGKTIDSLCHDYSPNQTIDELQNCPEELDSLLEPRLHSSKELPCNGLLVSSSLCSHQDSYLVDNAYLSKHGSHSHHLYEGTCDISYTFPSGHISHPYPQALRDRWVAIQENRFCACELANSGLPEGECHAASCSRGSKQAYTTIGCIAVRREDVLTWDI